ncbi:MAG TPA: HEAT repeat domain-containing protein [Methanocella sp.]|jgi:hypothetical protein
MGKYSAPGIGHGSKIYRMAKNRNDKVLFTSVIIFIFGILALYDGVVRPVAQTPAGILLDFLIIGIALYGFYLFLTRTLDIFRHPDVKKFLSFDDPRHYINLFEQEASDVARKKISDALVTRNFIVGETFYRFRWAHAKEITAAYIERARVRYPIPFIGVNTVVVHLDNRSALHINCDTISEAESLLKMLMEIAPSAHYGSAIYEKPDLPADYEAIVQDMEDTIRHIPGYKQPDVKISAHGNGLKSNTPAENKTPISSPVKPVAVSKAETARVRQLSKEELFDRQIKNLYDSLDKGDIAQSVNVIDTMGDGMNFAAADILEILLEYLDEPVRVHAAFTLGKLGQKSSVEPLVRALDDPSVQVRENAAIALGKIGDQRAVAPLQQVSTEDIRAKKAAVSALARIDQKLGIYNRTDGQTSFFSTALEKNR